MQQAAQLEFKETGAVSYTAVCVPPARMNYSMGRFYTPAEAEEAPALRDELRLVAERYGARQLYGPSVGAMSGRMVRACQIVGAAIPLGNGITLYRNKEEPSDGLPLEPGDGVPMSTGGCQVLVASGGSPSGKAVCLVAHAARDSLIDREFIRTGVLTPGREYVSIVEHMAAAARNLGVDPSYLDMKALFSLPAEVFAHPLKHEVFRDYNEKLVAYARELDETIVSERDDVAYLDNAGLALAQARKEGFRSCEEHCTLPVDGPFGHTRHPDPDMRNPRNLVFVCRHT